MSLIKIAVPGHGFAALERLGLAAKALERHAGSDWLKNAAPKIVTPKILPKVEQAIPKVISTTEYNQQLMKKMASYKYRCKSCNAMVNKPNIECSKCDGK